VLGAFDAAMDWTVVSWLKAQSAPPILLKGVLTAADVRRGTGRGCTTSDRPQLNAANNHPH